MPCESPAGPARGRAGQPPALILPLLLLISRTNDVIRPMLSSSVVDGIPAIFALAASVAATTRPAIATCLPWTASIPAAILLTPLPAAWDCHSWSGTAAVARAQRPLLTDSPKRWTSLSCRRTATALGGTHRGPGRTAARGRAGGGLEIVAGRPGREREVTADCGRVRLAVLP